MIPSLSTSDSVRIMAWGRAISRAINVGKVTQRSFLTDLVVDAIGIGTEGLGEVDAERNVSIQLSKPKA